MPTVEEQNEIERERVRTRYRDRARIFREVFGLWDKPTTHGKVILDALLAKFGHELPPNVLDNNGRTDEYQTWRRLGHFDVLEYIKAQLEWKESEYTNVNPSNSGSQ
jgi:hypothetical protein